jgi:magnesium transporter
LKSNLNEYLTTRVPISRLGDSAGHVFEKIKKDAFDYSQHIFVTDQQNHLKGCIELILLLKSDPSIIIDTLFVPYHNISINKSIEYAANFAIHHKTSFIPVINDENVFMGIIPPQVIINTLRKEHIDDLHKIAGIRKESSIAGRAVTEPPTRSVRHRLPWLLVGLSGSFLATYIMSGYEEMLNRNISLSFFIPGIVYLADAIGTQTETIVIRGLSLTWTTFKKNLIKELLTGLLIGIILGLLSLTVAFLGGFDLRISLVVGISIIISGMLATTIGLILPWLLRRFGKDPAFGSGPLATIIQDILSILVYLLIAKNILSVV